jgi:uncharacterized membrane protein (DUF373 family)
MKKVLQSYVHLIVGILLLLMMVAVLAATVELGVILYGELMKPPQMLLNIDEMLEVFGFFLMVLIGVELLETIKAYLEEERVHAEVVFLVAIVAVSRKVIILDYKTADPQLLLAMSAIIIALGIGYYLVCQAVRLPPKSGAVAPDLATESGHE